MSKKVYNDPEIAAVMATAEDITPEERIERCRRIVKNWQYEKIDGEDVDGTSAAMLVNVYDKLSQKHQKHLLMHFGEHIRFLIGFGWKLVGKVKGGK